MKAVIEINSDRGNLPKPYLHKIRTDKRIAAISIGDGSINTIAENNATAYSHVVVAVIFTIGANIY